MSWDIIIFNLSRKVDSAEEIGNDILVNIGGGPAFRKILNEYFNNIKWDGDRGVVEGVDYSIEFFARPDGSSVSSSIFHLYGEKAIYPLIDLCRRNNWQAFDTGIGQMLDLDHPEMNGYEKFHAWLADVLKNKA